MVCDKKMKQWIQDNAGKLSLVAQELTWIENWLPGYHDFSVKIEVEGRQFVGRGISDDEDTAIVKATVEAIERSAALALGLPSTSGFACHVTSHDAAQHARMELVERDTFFCHYFTRSPFSKIDASKLLPLPFIGTVIARLEAQGVQLRFAKMNGPRHASQVVCGAFGENAKKPFGVVVGLGCKIDFEAAAFHAMTECLLNVVTILEDTNVAALNLIDFSSIENPRAHDHLRLGLSLTAGKNFAKLFETEKGAWASDDTSIEVNPVPLAALPRLFHSAPLYFCLATSPSVQTAVFGHTKPTCFNLARLSHFAGRTLTADELETFPHPMG